MSPNNPMFTRGMEMELHQIVHLLANSNRVIMGIRTRRPVNLDRMPIKMSDNVFERLIVECKSLGSADNEPRKCVGVDVHGRLLETLVAEYVGWVQETPMTWSRLVCAVLVTR